MSNNRHYTNKWKISTIHYESETYYFFHGRDEIFVQSMHDSDLQHITEENYEHYWEVRDYIDEQVLDVYKERV